MDLKRIRYFHAVATLGGIRQASEQLHVSAPAISRGIQQLEHDLGRSLVQPAGRGIELTEDGHAAARWASRVLEEISSVSRAFERTDAAQIRVGTFEFFMTHALAPLLDVLPSTLVMRDLPPDSLEDALLQRRIDVGITVKPYPKADIEHVPAGRYRLGVYALKGQFRACGPSDTPFAAPLDIVADSPMYHRAQDGWPEKHAPRHITHYLEMMETGLELCRRGVTAAFLPDFIVHLHNRTVAEPFRLHPIHWDLPAAVEQVFPAYVVRRTGEERSPAHALADRIAQRLEALFDATPAELVHRRARAS